MHFAFIGEISHLVLQADKSEIARNTRMAESIESLKRLYPGWLKYSVVLLDLNICAGVLGRVTDLCKPRQRKHNIAVSVILGKNMDAIVVETEAVAIECVKYMRNQQGGRATFIPLDTIIVKPINETLRFGRYPCEGFNVAHNHHSERSTRWCWT